MSDNKKRLVITGSEGLIGKKLTEYYSERFDVLKLSRSLNNDLTDENFVNDWFKKNRHLYGMIVCHAFNPVPVQESVKIDPLDVPLSEVRQYFEVNVVSAYNVCRHFIKNNQSGTIINISSIYGLVSPKHHLYRNFTKPIGYSLSKSSVIMMSKYLATYYAPDFRINTVILGGVFDKRIDSEFVRRYSENVPIGRMMNMTEMTSVFDFLLDERSGYVTGSEFVVDGGWTSW